MFAIFFAYYNRWHQSINWSAVEILIKINLEKALKLNCLDICSKKKFFSKNGVNANGNKNESLWHAFFVSTILLNF